MREEGLHGAFDALTRYGKESHRDRNVRHALSIEYMSDDIGILVRATKYEVMCVDNGEIRLS